MSKKASETNKQSKQTPIAIVGMASIFPQAHNLQEYWDNILRKIDTLIEVPASRWNADEYYDPNPTAQDKVYCKRGGFIPDIDFDPVEFGLPPNILEVTDVSQLLGLVAAKDAMEDAGYGEGREFDHDMVGCILGIVGISMKLYAPLVERLQYPVWEKVLLASGVTPADTQKIINKIKLAYVNWEENAFPGIIGNVVAGRIANRLDLGGSNYTVDAACGTSLAALKAAVDELQLGRADMMLTGAVDLDNSVGTFMCFSKTPAFSRSQEIRPFDEKGDGMMVGEGIGMMVIKRLEDAERDGDRIYAVIRGIGSSSDGRYKSIYAPRPEGQAKAMRRAYDQAGYSHTTVSLVEAHGTGTSAGDPSEFGSMNTVFSENNPHKQVIALGSVKSMIGHTKATAGFASLIKTTLGLYHKVLPPTIKVTRPNPKLGIEDSPFYLNTEARPWLPIGAGIPRRAGVSAFGFGGTNFHVTLEEYIPEHEKPYRINSVPQSILFSAADPAQLLSVCQQELAKLGSAEGKAALNQLAAASKTLDIPQADARLGFVAESLDEAKSLLQAAVDHLKSKADAESWDHPKGIWYRKSGLDPQGKVVALFPGQGAQYLEMGKELALNFPAMRQSFKAVDDLFLKEGQQPLSRAVFPPPVFDAAARDALDKNLTRTENAQPAIGAFCLGVYKLLQNAGFKPDFTAGHSFGELAALWAAGVVSDTDYYTLAKARGKAMAPPDDPNFDAGTMLAVKGDVAKVLEELKAFPDITAANLNSKNQVVLAGSKPAIAKVQQALSEKGYGVVALSVSAAFHTALVGHAQKPFAEVIKRTKFNKPGVRVYSNTTGQEYPADPKQIQDILSDHILKSVLFKDQVENIYAAGGSIFVEFGPKSVLTNLVGNILEGKPHVAVALNASPKKDSDRQWREAALQLRVAGLALKNVDPYELEKTAPVKKKSAVTVQLNGGLYVTEKTRAAFENALKDGFKVSLPAAAAAPTPMTVRPEGVEGRPVEGRLAEERLRQAQPAARPELVEGRSVEGRPVERQPVEGRIADGMAQLLMRMEEVQSEAVRAHAQFLNSQAAFNQGFINLLAGTPVSFPAQSPASMPAPLAPAVPVVAAIPAAVVEMPQLVQAPVPSGNGHNIEQPAAPAAVLAPVVSTPIVAAAPKAASGDGSVSPDAIKTALLAIVSEKTGYPSEMVDLDMDMEADLGIDSIKRVEILGAVQERFPQLPKIEAAALSDLRTLGQIIEHIGGLAPAVDSAQSDLTPPAPLPLREGGGVSPDAIKTALLAIVSEKTGYPSEMVDLDMDMEADLGIDSIKRVEILGAVQERFPQLPKIEAAALSDLRTLGQIIEHIGGLAPAVDSAQSDLTPPAPLPLREGGGVSPDAIKTALLAIVSEKTGYPSEMVDLDMDMEADLGIDSIKRVEILGAVQERFPQLPKIEAAALSDLRTLGQIIEHIGGLSPVAAAPPPSIAPLDLTPPAHLPSSEGVVGTGWEEGGGNSQSELTVQDIPVYSVPRGLVGLRSLPQPDRMTFNLPEGSACLVSDDGTEMTSGVVKALVERGWKVVVASFPQDIVAGQAAVPQGVQRVTIEDMSEEGLQKAFAGIGPVAAFIHLNPVENRVAAGVSLYSGADRAILKHVFLVAKFLKQPLQDAARQGHAAFMTVARLDGEFGLTQDSQFLPASGGLFGLVKTLSLEWSGVSCRALDLNPHMDVEEAVQAILTELHDPNRVIVEVGYGPNGRKTLVVEHPN